MNKFIQDALDKKQAELQEAKNNRTRPVVQAKVQKNYHRAAPSIHNNFTF
jgi:hypothetical protein